jgi:HlyD family secretion protein
MAIAVRSLRPERNVRKLFIAVLIGLPLLGLGGWLYRKKTDAPQVTFARVKRETLISTLPTNGKVEPIQWTAVRTDLAGLVERLPVHEGQKVSTGAVLAELTIPGLQSELTEAQTRVAQAQAELATIERGGRPTDLTEIENRLARAKLDHEGAQREYNDLRRLEEKQAVTHIEVIRARGSLRETEIELESLERKRAALIANTDKPVAQAKLKEAEAAVDRAQRKISQTAIHSPLAGVVYNLPIRLGAYVNPGDLVANIGRLDRLRVRVYVDEPELGRVAVGQQVTISWDALPGKQWRGAVEQMPTQVAPLGTRQVGEVLCTIENPEGELVPGSTINAEIRTGTVANALTIPKEALRHDAATSGVFLLQGSTVAWRAVKVGVTSVTRAQITDGLAEGDAVALPGDRQLRDGDSVTPLYP